MEPETHSVDSMPQHAGVDFLQASEDEAHPAGDAHPDNRSFHPETSRAHSAATLGEARGTRPVTSLSLEAW
jgi:hypothetical protein